MYIKSFIPPDGCIQRSGKMIYLFPPLLLFHGVNNRHSFLSHYDVDKLLP